MTLLGGYQSIMKKILGFSLLVLTALTLSACNNEEKLKIQQTVVDFKPMKKYSEGRAEEYVVEEKNAEEIASEIFKEQIGIVNNNETSFAISGNTDTENVFVHALVSDGSNLPTLSGISDSDAQAINSGGGLDVWEEDNQEDFNALLKSRKVASAELEGNSEKKLTDSIQDAIDYREKIQTEEQE